jgi:hypothetical protein
MEEQIFNISYGLIINYCLTQCYTRLHVFILYTRGVSIALVCLSVEFIFLNIVKSCYKSDVNIMMTLQGTTTPEAVFPYNL